MTVVTGRATLVTGASSGIGAATARLLAACSLAGFAFAPLPAAAELKVGVSDWPGWVAWYVAEHEGLKDHIGHHHDNNINEDDGNDKIVHGYEWKNRVYVFRN